jgi:hypothetical protein
MIGSALEHAVPEQMFQAQDSTDQQPEAISAVKALQMAGAEGQRIYQITQANMDTALPYINHDGKSEIQAALQAGMMVITHTDSVSVPGWTGGGYIILDPEDLTGAYKISGGLDGGVFAAIGATLSSLFVAALWDGFAGAGAPALAFALSILVSVVAIYYLYGLIWGEDAQHCFVLGLAVGLSGMGLLSKFIGTPLGNVGGKTAALILAIAANDISNYGPSKINECMETL